MINKSKPGDSLSLSLISGTIALLASGQSDSQTVQSIYLVLISPPLEGNWRLGQPATGRGPGFSSYFCAGQSGQLRPVPGIF